MEEAMNADEVVENMYDIICIHLNDMVAETNLISHGDYLRKWAMKLSKALSGVLVPSKPKRPVSQERLVAALHNLVGFCEAYHESFSRVREFANAKAILAEINEGDK